MSDDNDEDETLKPALPPIQDLTTEQFNRLLCADYLESIAKMIRSGSVTGFTWSWNYGMDKPKGNVFLDCDALKSPMELRVMAGIAQARQQEQANKIPVQDISEELKDHQCDDPACFACQTRKNDLKD